MEKNIVPLRAPALVIYHANCIDGFASAWAFHTLQEKECEKVEYVAMNYGDSLKIENLATLVGWDVYILDFSFPRQMIVDIASYAKSVLILDHHKTAREIFE